MEDPGNNESVTLDLERGQVLHDMLATLLLCPLVSPCSPLALEHAKQEVAPKSPVVPPKLANGSFVGKSKLLVQPPRSVVVLKRIDRHSMQSRALEGPLQNPRNRFGSVALSLTRRQQAKANLAVSMVGVIAWQRVEIDDADGFAVFGRHADHHGKQTVVDEPVEVFLAVPFGLRSLDSSLGVDKAGGIRLQFVDESLIVVFNCAVGESSGLEGRGRRVDGHDTRVSDRIDLDFLQIRKALVHRRLAASDEMLSTQRGRDKVSAPPRHRRMEEQGRVKLRRRCLGTSIRTAGHVAELRLIEAVDEELRRTTVRVSLRLPMASIS